MSAYAHAPLGEVCAVNPRARRTEYPQGMVVSFVPMAAVDERLGVIAVREERPLADVSKGFTSFEDGDVLFAKITPCMENGKAALARNLINGIGRGSTEFYVLRPGERVLGEYIYHFVRRKRFREEAKRSFTGTAGQQRVPRSFMESALVPLPPLAEQRRIADILNRAARIERLRARAIDHLHTFAPALFVKMFGDPVDNPMGWSVVQLGEVCEMDRQGLQPNDTVTQRLPFVGVENVRSGTGTLDFDTDSRVGSNKSTTFRFDARHVLYAKLRPYLNKVATPDFEGRCSTELVPLLPRENIDRDFLAYLLRREETVAFVMASVTGARMPRTDMKVLMSMLVPFPPLNEQRRIADILNRAAQIGRLGSQAAKAASALTASLMDRLLDGSPAPGRSGVSGPA